jgi:phospholipase A1
MVPRTHPLPPPHGNNEWREVQDEEYKQLWGRVKPGNSHLELLDESSEVCVPSKDGDGGLFPVDTLDPSLYVPLHVVYYFHNLIWFLEKHKYVAGQSLFGFGYDFRQSNMAHLDALQARLQDASNAAHGAKCAATLRSTL